MGFEITNKIKSDGITLNELLASVKGKKEEKNIRSIFETFNTNKAADGGTEKLDVDEQEAMFKFLKELAGDNNKVSRREARKSDGVKYSQYRDFVKALKNVVNNSKEPTIDENKKSVELASASSEAKAAEIEAEAIALASKLINEQKVVKDKPVQEETVNEEAVPVNAVTAEHATPRP